MTKQDYLRMAADDIEFGRKEYIWGCACSCNCGILVQNVMNKDYEGILETVRDVGQEDYYAEYSVMVENATICASTGRPISIIIAALRNAGFSDKEIVHLERLSDNSIRCRAGLIEFEKQTDRHDFRNSIAVTEYMRAWADLLDEQQPQETVKSASGADLTLSSHPVELPVDSIA